ncbi:hypothetical protein [Synechococcus sp. M16CYN]|uniref:hypothetical protein n=1 Tax=Synechococcus sp. M16CYN TaxID=3103139 RepID=UPI0033427B41
MNRCSLPKTLAYSARSVCWNSETRCGGTAYLYELPQQHFLEKQRFPVRRTGTN